MNDIVSMIFNIDKTRNCCRRGGDGYSRYANQKNDDATSITKVVKDANQISNFQYSIINCSITCISFVNPSSNFITPYSRQVRE